MTNEQTIVDERTRPALISALSAPKGFGDQTLRDRRADAIELLGGIPDPGALPTEEIAAASARVLAEPGVPALQYSRTPGIPALREWIAAREGVPSEKQLGMSLNILGRRKTLKKKIHQGILHTLEKIL